MPKPTNGKIELFSRPLRPPPDDKTLLQHWADRASDPCPDSDEPNVYIGWLVLPDSLAKAAMMRLSLNPAYSGVIQQIQAAVDRVERHLERLHEDPTNRVKWQGVLDVSFQMWQALAEALKIMRADEAAVLKPKKRLTTVQRTAEKKRKEAKRLHVGGLTNQQIANKMQISEASVSSYLKEPHTS